MPDYDQKQIARMLGRGTLSEAEALVALRLVCVLQSAVEPMGRPRSAATVASHSGRGRANRCEQRLVGQLADRRLFQIWQREMRGRGRDPDIALGVLLLGQTLSALDRARKRRKGWAQRELRQGIEVFHRLIQGRCKETSLDRAGQREYQIG